MTFSLYGFILGLSFVLGLWNVQRLLPQEKHVSWDAGALLIFGFGVAGARLYHLITDWHLYTNASTLELLAVWNGGLGLIGGLIGGFAGYLIWRNWQRPHWSTWAFLDAAALALPWSQALGRLGNYFNQELFGPPTTLPWGVFIAPENRPPAVINFTHFHPLFLYEMMGSVILGILLLLLHKRKLALDSGVLAGLYLAGYGTLRFFLEYLRLESAPGPFGLSIAQLASLAAISLGILLVVSKHRRLQ
jgi:phosphatidylglycerol:prolipoprotein diacylglycerol transferase